MLKPRFHTVLIFNVGHQTFWIRYRTQTWARNVQILSMLKSVLNAVLRQTQLWSRRNWSITLSKFVVFDVQSDFSIRVAYEVLSIHLKRWCNKNDLTDTVLCLKRQCLLNICKLKRQTTTVRYSVAIIMFWWQFFGDGTIRLLLGDTSSQPDEISPKLCVVVGRVIKYSHGHLAIPMYYSDLLEINYNNMNEGKF